MLQERADRDAKVVPARDERKADVAFLKRRLAKEIQKMLDAGHLRAGSPVPCCSFLDDPGGMANLDSGAHLMGVNPAAQLRLEESSLLDERRHALRVTRSGGT